MTALALKSYIAVVSTRFRTLLQYRIAAIAGIVTQVFWGLMKLMVFSAFYEVAQDQPPLSFESIVAYVWLGQCLFALFPYNVDPDMRAMFNSGSVAYDMLRPLSLYGYWFSRTLAFRTAPTVLRLVPGLFFAFVVLRLVGLDEWVMPLPPSFVAAFSFFISILLTVALSASIMMLVSISMFWLIDSRGMVNLTAGVVWVLGGMIIPLPLFPDWMQPFLSWQPFRGLCDIPFRIYSGDIAGFEIVGELMFQLAWVAILVLAGAWLMRRAQVKLTVQGG